MNVDRDAVSRAAGACDGDQCLAIRFAHFHGSRAEGDHAGRVVIHNRQRRRVAFAERRATVRVADREVNHLVRFVEAIVENRHFDHHRAGTGCEGDGLRHAGVIAAILGAAILRREVKGDAAGLADRAGDGDERDWILLSHAEAGERKAQCAAHVVIDDGDDRFGEVAKLAAGRVAESNGECLTFLHRIIVEDANGERPAGDAGAEGDRAVRGDEICVAFGAASRR